jgi:RNA recognition motif-containing protein
MRTLYVGGLPAATSDDSLRELFSRFGPIQCVRVAARQSGECRGFAYVTFRDPESATRAVSAANGVEVRGAKLRVDLAR